MSNILILNSAARKNGNTADLIHAFTEAATKNGNIVREIYLADKNIHTCLGCTACTRNGGNCVQKDDMSIIYDGMEWADVIVFASPIYFNSITGLLKMVNDRMFSYWNKHFLSGRETPKKKTALILTSAGHSLEQALGWYSFFELYGKWENLGVINGSGSGLGIGKADDKMGIAQARELGASIH
ncbi:MAG: flavodoxin family protein [Eubacteriales bacterium]|nr:flavodoxin family protein [Eubacteriales bacterium]